MRNTAFPNFSRTPTPDTHTHTALPNSAFPCAWNLRENIIIQDRIAKIGGIFQF